MLKKSFLSDIRNMLSTARQKAYAAINSTMVEAYWLIGKRVVEEEQNGKEKADYGTFLIKELAKHLTEEFGKGFDERELRRMRQFFLTFPIRDALRPELSWTHYRILLRVESPTARDYYVTEVAAQSWSTRQLERNINTLYYERLLSTQNKRAALIDEQDMEKISSSDIIKNPYVLEFLGMQWPTGYSESEIESAIINNLQSFLLELGKGFSFVGRQYRIKTDTKVFYIDLVFYNYILKCFVLIDLKINELTHQDIGQMDMYVRMFEDLKKTEGDNPTIGIILCAEKDHTIVKYSILEENKQLFASKYRLVLPTEEELRAELEREKQLIHEQITRKE
ncbi:YhcG family protein [Chitinophaga sp. HK235]|uniref:PDDEXK nuclease domain-containing protein n=1 Tax=Chitinophaga sp. HK235 TaxID=2952571 RepID=UPI001BA5C924|nr:PDDEXK nuclease domain-containing protein [Chitinophaga sp. HK235]